MHLSTNLCFFFLFVVCFPLSKRVCNAELLVYFLRNGVQSIAIVFKIHIGTVHVLSAECTPELVVHSIYTKALLNKHKLERLLVINDAFELRGLITVKDITKQTSFPLAARDVAGRLRVGAAVGVGEGTEERSRPWSRRVWTPSWSTPPMATAKA